MTEDGTQRWTDTTTRYRGRKRWIVGSTPLTEGGFRVYGIRIEDLGPEYIPSGKTLLDIE